MSDSTGVFTGVVMTGRRIKFWAYLGWNGEEQILKGGRTMIWSCPRV